MKTINKFNKSIAMLMSKRSYKMVIFNVLDDDKYLESDSLYSGLITRITTLESGEYFVNPYELLRCERQSNAICFKDYVEKVMELIGFVDEVVIYVDKGLDIAHYLSKCLVNKKVSFTTLCLDDGIKKSSYLASNGGSYKVIQKELDMSKDMNPTLFTRNNDYTAYLFDRAMDVDYIRKAEQDVLSFFDPVLCRFNQKHRDRLISKSFCYFMLLKKVTINIDGMCLSEIAEIEHAIENHGEISIEYDGSCERLVLELNRGHGAKELIRKSVTC